MVLSGEGADEIFAGYETYDISGLSRKYRKIPKFLRSAAAKCAAKLPYFKGHDFIIKNGEQPEITISAGLYFYRPRGNGYLK